MDGARGFFGKQADRDEYEFALVHFHRGANSDINAAVPALVAAADHKYDAAAGPATVLVAACVIVTAFLAPPLVAWIDRRTRRRLTSAQESRSELNGSDAGHR
jgi:hypothetical protein